VARGWEGVSNSGFSLFSPALSSSRRSFFVDVASIGAYHDSIIQPGTLDRYVPIDDILTHRLRIARHVQAIDEHLAGG